MKVFVFFFVLLTTNYLVSAQSDDAKRVQQEAQQFLNSLISSYRNEGTSFRNGVSSRATSYYNSFINLRLKTGEYLRSLGGQSQSIASRYINEINFYIFTLQSEFSSQSIELKLQRVFLTLNSQYVSRLQSDIKDLGSIVSENPAGIKCWDENKEILKALLNLVLQQFQFIFRSDLDALTTQVRDISNIVNRENLRIEKDVETNCPERNINCIIEYYEVNSEDIFRTFGNYRDIAINGLRNDILKLTAAKGVEVVERSFEYYQDYKSIMENCIAKRPE